MWFLNSASLPWNKSLKVGQKVGPEVGFPVEAKRKPYFRTYFLAYFGTFPETNFWATFGLLYFFSRIWGLVTHAGRHERNVLTEETWFSLLREWKSWKLQWELFSARQQVLLSKNFHSRPGCRQKILAKELWGWRVGVKFDPHGRLGGRFRCFFCSLSGVVDREEESGAYEGLVFLRVLSATFILSKNSRVLGAKSRQKSGNLG